MPLFTQGFLDHGGAHAVLVDDQYSGLVLHPGLRRALRRLILPVGLARRNRLPGQGFSAREMFLAQYL
jgi:hypothetical protein